MTVLLPPTISKAVNTTVAPVGATWLVTLTLSNANASALTGGAFTDPLTGMTAVGGPVGGTCSGTAPNALAAGSTALSFTGITIPANSFCTVTFFVTSNTTGVENNTTSGVTTAQTPVTGAVSNTASITIGGNFLISYASNLTNGDAFIDLTNTGANGAALNGPGFGAAAGNLCINVYAFSPDEQPINCCSCLVTPNGLASLSVNQDVTSKH